MLYTQSRTSLTENQFLIFPSWHFLIRMFKIIWQIVAHPDICERVLMHAGDQFII